MKTITHTLRRFLRLAAPMAALIGTAAFLHADDPAPLYQWDFSSGGANSGSGSGGTLTISNNTSGTVAFGDGVLDASGNIGANSDPHAQAGYASAALTGLQSTSLTTFTITFWVYTPTKKSGYQDILTIGPASGATSGSDNVLFVRYNSSNGNNNNKLEVWPVGGTGVSGITAQQTEEPATGNGVWTFVALSYDGTSSKVDNSTLQAAATGALAAENRGTANLQIYQGSDAVDDALMRNGYYWGQSGDNWSLNKGALNLGADATIFLGSLADYSRSLSGILDDVRIYDEVLSASQIDAIRLQQIAPIPEPGSSSAFAALAVLALIASGRRRRR